MILSLPRFLVAPLLVSMSDARGDAESKQRAKRERLEAWRREQAEKKRAEASGDSSPKRARVEKPFGFRSAAAAHKAGASAHQRFFLPNPVMLVVGHRPRPMPTLRRCGPGMTGRSSMGCKTIVRRARLGCAP